MGFLMSTFTLYKTRLRFCVRHFSTGTFLYDISSLWWDSITIISLLVTVCIENPDHRSTTHDDVIKWKHSSPSWHFVRGIHRSPVNSLHKGQWRGDFMFSLICARINGWVNTREAGDLRRYRAHYDVIVMNPRFRRRHEWGSVFDITTLLCIDKGVPVAHRPAKLKLGPSRHYLCGLVRKECWKKSKIQSIPDVNGVILVLF